MCFRRRHSIRMANECLKKANPRTESYTSGSRTPSVDLRFRSFSIKPVESARSSSIGFFFVSPLKQKWHKSVIRNYTKSVTSKPEHVRLFLPFDCRWSPTACQSMTFLQHVQDSSALSHKNLHVVASTSTVGYDVSTTHLVAGHSSRARERQSKWKTVKTAIEPIHRPYNFQDGRQFSQALFTKVEHSDRSDEGLGSRQAAEWHGYCSYAWSSCRVTWILLVCM